MNVNLISPAVPTAPPQRLASLDAYRGLVMFLMMAEVVHLGRVSELLPDSGFWRFLAHHQEHVAWVGCSLHDLIQPSFSFMVGVALPFSIASRLARGHSQLMLSLHAFWRALVLIMLGIFLRSIGRPQTYFTFEDTLTQIGLGYGFLFLLGFGSARNQWAALALILVGYWAAFALYPLPGPDFDYTKVGVPKDWPYLMTGFAAHWNKNSNLAWAFDTWFLNLFPREQPFAYNSGGYATLSFIPTLGTMILGLLAGNVLRRQSAPWDKVRWLVTAGAVGLGLGLLLNALGLCPSVKRIWTPSWTLFSGGWCFLLLAGFYIVVDILGHRHWAFFLIVVGMNSIAAYCMAHLFEGFVLSSLKTHIGLGFFRMFGPAYESLVSGGCVLAIFWLLLLWMYHRKLFLKI
jgi:heparan-alpha-glucosaminide N-acetyltransferase